MAALRSRCGHYIFILWFLLSFFLSSISFPRLISAVADWMSTILPHMVWPYYEFKMQVWNVLNAARWNTGRKKSPKILHLRTIAFTYYYRTTLSGYIFTTKACIDNWKNQLSSNTSCTCPYNMVNLSPLAAETVSLAWGTPGLLSTGFASWQRYCTAL